MTRHLVLSLVGMMLLSTCAQAEGEKLVVHEWGTFTSLQDEQGKAIGAINADGEAVPPFVVNLLSLEGGPKGFPVSDSITMRLETPVVYFHLPKNSAPMKLDFSAEFHGGLLTQFFPNAEHETIAMPATIGPDSVGKLEWKDFTIGTTGEGPQTTDHVWLAPRDVETSNLTAADGASERFLFYRGVGAIDAPLKVQRIDSRLRITGDPKIVHLWYLDIRPDGLAAYRALDTGNQDKPGIVTSAAFEQSDYSSDTIAKMRSEMQKELVAAGLFEDEAKAMLNTWEQAYFKSPGSRVMFLVPRKWVDERLPIKLSVPATIERVMVGRIDLVGPAQHELAQAYLRLPVDTSANAKSKIRDALGRFAMPILRDEAARLELPVPPEVATAVGDASPALLMQAFPRRSENVQPDAAR